MLTLRKRGRHYHIRGSIRVGMETRIVAEHSTGCDRKEDAEAYRAKLEGEIRQELVGDGRVGSRYTIADAGLAYLNRPGGVKSYDQWRLGEINRLVGSSQLSRAAEAWSEFKRLRCAGLAPATVQRFRAIFQAALNYLAEERQIQVPRLKGGGASPKRIRFLSQQEERALLSAYAPHVRPIAEVLADEGLRIGEALRLDWRHVNWAGNSLFIVETKTGYSRSVTLHSLVRKTLHTLWVERGSPDHGFVFLNRIGRPYADTRKYLLPGGSPIRSAHQTALKRAGITNFRVHDWRHHWACRCVEAGIDLETIRQEGGWTTLRMVERYSAVSAAHRANAMKKLK
jgi:integrase